MSMRDLAAHVESPSEAHAMVMTAGAAAAHMALLIIERARLREELRMENGQAVIGGRDADSAVIDAAVSAWKTVYAFRGL